MSFLDRRAALRVACAGLALGLTAGARPARAALVRGLKLPDLVRGSRSVCRTRFLEASCRWEEIGGRRVIVTDSELEVLDVVAKEAPRPRIVVRSLGGRVGRVAQLVHGQARFAPGIESLVFLTNRDERYYVAGFAQGHYPLTRVQAPTLTTSPDLPEMLQVRHSAVERLVGQTVPGARDLILEAMQP